MLYNINNLAWRIFMELADSKGKDKEQGQPRAWLALVFLILAAVMDMMDVCIVNVALPVIRSDMKTGYSMLQWIIAGYTLTFAVLLITGGRLGDIFGRKKMFLIGIAGFTVSSAICGIAPTAIVLVVSRFVQGAFAAIMVPQVLSFIQVIFPVKQRGAAAAVYGIISGLASVAGPVIGATITQNNFFGLMWRPIFYINVPVGITAFIASAILLKESKASNAHSLDIKGVVIISLAMVLLLYPIIQGSDLGWPVWGFVMMAVAILIFVLFVRYELKIKENGSPLMVLSLFKNRAFTVGVLINFLIYSGVTSFFMLFNIYSQTGLGYTVLNAGLITLPWSIGMFLASAPASTLVYKYGKRILLVGTLLLTVGIGGLIYTISHFGLGVTGFQLSISMVIAGFGMGLTVPILLTIVLAGVPQTDAGSASGIINTSSQLGNSIGIAIIGVLLYGVLASASTASVNSVLPEIKSGLQKTGMSTQMVDKISDGYKSSFITSMSGSNLSADNSQSVPAMSQISPEAKKVLVTESNKAVKLNFATATKYSLIYNIVVFALSFLLMFIFPAKVDVKAQERS